MSTSTEQISTRSGVRPLRRIVVGYDASTSALAAVHRALTLAAEDHAEVRVVTAWEAPMTITGFPLSGDEQRSIAEERLADLTKELFPTGAPPRFEVRAVEGPAARVLEEQSHSADLLVVGSRGLGPVRRMFLGSVSSACAAHSECPVLVVRGADVADVVVPAEANVPASTSVSEATIVVVRGTEKETSAVDWATEYAAAAGLDVRTLDARDATQSSSAGGSALDVADEIQSEARDARLVVISSSLVHNPWHRSLGERLVGRLEIPLVVVPALATGSTGPVIVEVDSAQTARAVVPVGVGVASRLDRELVIMQIGRDSDDSSLRAADRIAKESSPDRPYRLLHEESSEALALRPWTRESGLLIVGVPKPPVGGRAWLRGPVRDLLRSPAGPLMLVPVPVSETVSAATRTAGPLSPARPAVPHVIVDWHTSDDSRAGLEWAVARIEAEALGGERPELILTRVCVSNGSETETAREMLDASTEVALQTDALAQSHPDFAVRGETIRVARHEDLAGLASAGDLIVVTAPPPQGVSRARLRDLAEESASSGVVVPASWTSVGSGEAGGQGIVVGVDDGEPSAAALRFAVAEAAREAQPLRAVHAWLRPPIWKGATVSAEALTAALTKEQSDLLETWCVNAVGVDEAARVERRVVEGHPAAGLVAESRGARLLVVGTHGRHAAARFVLGSVSASLLDHPVVPTIVVRA